MNTKQALILASLIATTVAARPSVAAGFLSDAFQAQGIVTSVAEQHAASKNGSASQAAPGFLEDRVGTVVIGGSGGWERDKDAHFLASALRNLDENTASKALAPAIAANQ